MTAPAPRLDHVVIGVRDLDTAESLLCSSGFRSSGGGSHPGFGTENRLVRFESEYLELIGVADPDAARAAGRGTLVDRLAAGDEGLVAFALRGFPVEHVIERAAAVGMDVRGPVSMSRRSATAAAAWRLAIPHGDQYGGWWPFFIEWSDGGPGSSGYRVVDHPNGATRISEVTVATADLDPVRALLEGALGMRPHAAAPASGLSARPADTDASSPVERRERVYRLGRTTLRFVEVSGHPRPGRVREGVSGIRIAAEPDAAPLASDRSAPSWMRQIEVTASGTVSPSRGSPA